MEGTAEAAKSTLSCERCHGSVSVQRDEDSGKAQVKCKACGHTREAVESENTWTVIGPDGKVLTFGSWEELRDSGRPPSAVVTAAAPANDDPPKKIEDKLTDDAAPQTEQEPDPVTLLTPPDRLPEKENGTNGAAAAAPDLGDPPPKAVEREALPSEDPPKVDVAPQEVEEPKRVSGSALLDVTPTLTLPKLTLSNDESDPSSVGELGKKIGSNPPLEMPDVIMREKVFEQTPKAEAKPQLAEKAPDSIPELDAAALEDAPASADPLSLKDAIVEDADDAAPLSLRDAIPDSESEPAPLSLKDAIPDDEEESSKEESSKEHETLSLADVVVVPPAENMKLEEKPAPPPPAKGALGTLAPTKRGSAEFAVPPPPTITVDSKPPSKGETKRDLPPKPERAEVKGPPKRPTPVPRSDSVPPTKKAGEVDAKPSVAPARSPIGHEEQQPKRGWVIPSLVVAAVAVIIWRIMAASPSNNATGPAPQPTPTSTSTTASTTTTPATNTTTTTAPPTTDTAKPTTTTTAPVPTMGGVIPTTPDGKPRVVTAPGEAASGEKKIVPSLANMPTSDLLDKAAAARRTNDFATARSMYEAVLKQNPGNVEANGGLGDVSRAQGDLAGAKASYERALAASPAYGPAQLGLADTEWDMGDKGGAQRRYAQIVERLGDRAPERARTRSGTPSAAPTATATE